MTQQLFGFDVPTSKAPYIDIYHALQRVRDGFHREGRVSDSNAKLDETVKLLIVHFARLRGLVTDFDYQALSRRQTFTVDRLNRVLLDIADEPLFVRRGMGSIFGEIASTTFRQGDERIAFDLFMAARHAFTAQVTDSAQLDILNEAFGHHVRDNFRNHIEDAQYMTPPEVVNFMVDMAVSISRPNHPLPQDQFIVTDPSCGVGSFLARWRTVYEQRFGTPRSSSLRCIGQDKVERMVRLSAINLILSSHDADDVFLGNTISDDSPLSEYDGRVDLILTNPPFGARFSVEDLKISSRRGTPFFSTSLSTTKVVESEFLFLDRYLTLLKPGGICLTIIPDRVVSAKGLAAVTRQHLTRHAEVVAIVELPSVTFAQAGTRTKTAILMFRKSVSPRTSYPVFFSEVTDIGFRVSRRKGVSVKNSGGINQLPEVLESFVRTKTPHNRATAGSVGASWRDFRPNESLEWTPRTVLFDREAIRRTSRHYLVPLRELTQPSRTRKPIGYSDDCYYIGVAHLIAEGVLDISGIKAYKPITPGVPVNPGEVLVSRINPRIPRVAVVPNLGRRLLCSSEFEILTPREEVSSYVLVFVLLSSFVQRQISALTAGTSASHSRVKPQRIYDVLMPRLDQDSDQQVSTMLRRYEECCQRITRSLVEIESMRNDVELLLAK